MKLINSKIGLKGLGRDLVNEGFGDLKVKIEGEEVLCMKCFLIHGNATFKKVLEDEKFDGVLELYEGCDIESFYEIERYYSGGTMELNELNVCKILSFCIYYNDKFLLQECKEYLKTHLNDMMMIEIFNILNEMKCKYMSDIMEMSEAYIKMNGYKYLNNEELLLKLRIEDLELILSCNNLIIENENWLLNQLLRWKNEMIRLLKDEKDDELKNEFEKLLRKYIHFEKIDVNEISNEVLNDLRELNLYDKVKGNYVSLDIKEISDNRIKEIIFKYYMEEDKIDFEIEEMKEIKENNVEEIISILLNKDDVKLNEIGIMVIIDSKTEYKIEKSIKNKIFKKLLNESENNRLIKCLCLFVDDVESIAIMKYLCGIEILFRILNMNNYLPEQSKELLINYVYGIDLTEEEESRIPQIISNNEVIERLSIKKITSFSYPQSEYIFGLNEEVFIIPSLDGNKCEFSINPKLPSGIVLDKESGIIKGRVEKSKDKKEYEITCKNRINKKMFKVCLEFNDGRFTELNKSEGISVSNDGKVITKTSGGRFVHAYLNLKMEKGIYHIKYKFIKRNNNFISYDNLIIGLSTNNTYSDEDLYYQSTTCNFYAYKCESQDIRSFCHIGRVVNENPNFSNHGDGSIYEMIVDMNKREFWISHNNSSPVLLVNYLPSPLYPYVSIYPVKNSVELLSVSHQNKISLINFF